MYYVVTQAANTFVKVIGKLQLQRYWNTGF